MANLIKLRRGTKAQILSAAGSLAEPLYSWDTKELFIGNGTGANTPLVSATSADITYYVRTDGNDSNTGLANTAAGAFKTISKATSLIPQIVNHAVTINIAAGTYNELVEIHGRSGKSSITLNGTGTTTYVKSVYMFGVQQANINNLTATDAGQIGFYFHSGGWAQFSGCVSTTATANDGFNVSYQYGVLRNCVVSNKTGAAISCNSGTITVDSCTGTGNAIAFYGDNSANISTKGTTVPAGASFVGAASVLNPWGDNNYNDRTFIEVSSNAAQSIPAGVNTKLLFNLKSFDTLFEYGGSTGRFTATKSGHYTVVAALLAQGFATNAELDFYVFINGGSGKTFRHVFRTNLESVSLPYVIPLNAGDYFELYLIASSSGFIGNGTADRTTLTIQREA